MAQMAIRSALAYVNLPQTAYADLHLCAHLPVSGSRYSDYKLNEKRKTQLNKGDNQMLNWAVTFFIIAIIAGLVGLSGIAAAATNIAWLLFVVFVVLFLVSLVAGRRAPR
jgi:uncharacterized membrane protein YtjA (UPF0391 family)